MQHANKSKPIQNANRPTNRKLQQSGSAVCELWRERKVNFDRLHVVVFYIRIGMHGLEKHCSVLRDVLPYLQLVPYNIYSEYFDEFSSDSRQITAKVHYSPSFIDFLNKIGDDFFDQKREKVPSRL